MAVIKYSGLVDQLRGKLNGTVFSKFHNGFNSYKKGQPKRWGSETQQRRRQFLQEIARAWSSLSPIERATWVTVASATPVLNRLGDEVFLPAYQYFVKYSMWYLLQGQALRMDLLTDLTKPSDALLGNTSLQVSQVGRLYEIAELSGQIQIVIPSPANTDFLVYLSSPFANEPIDYQGSYWYVGSFSSSGSTFADQIIPFSFTNVAMPDGWYSMPDAFHRLSIRPVQRARAQTWNPFTGKLQVDFIPPVDPVWDINLTWGNNSSRYVNLIAPGGNRQAGDGGLISVELYEALPGPASNYNFELAFSPNISGTDTPAPGDFNVTRPTLSGVMKSMGNPPEYGATITSGSEIQSFLNSNFTYNASNPYQYQPIAFRLQRPADSVWSDWTYSTIWLPAF